MIKEKILQTLNYELSEFVEDLNLEQLDFGLLQGNVYLENLRLKRGALRRFGIPLDVYRGLIKRLNVKISLLHWFTEPMQVEIEDVFVVVLPESAMPYDQGYEEKMAQHEKKSKLRDLDRQLAEEDETLDGESKQKASIFNLKLLAKTISNLQLTIDRLHVRYEDWSSNLSEGFSIGLTLSSLSLVSTDQGWAPISSRQSAEGGFYKKGAMSFLGVYLASQSESPFLRDKPDHEFEAQFQRLILESELKESSLTYLLRPLQAELLLSFSTDLEHFSPDQPKLSLCLLIDSFEIMVTQAQFHNLLLLAIGLLEPPIASSYRQLRPPPGTSPLVPYGARAYWSYAIGCVLQKIRDHKKTWSWSFMKERRDVRRNYIQTYQRLQTNQEAQRDFLLQALREFERDLSLEDIRFYRKLARGRLSQQEKMRVHAPKATGVQELLLEMHRRMATLEVEWLEWQLHAPETVSFLTKTSRGTFPEHLSEEEIWEIYNSVGYTPKDSEAFNRLPPDYIWFQVDIKISNGLASFWSPLQTDPALRIQVEELTISQKKQRKAEIVQMELGMAVIHSGGTLLFAPLEMFNGPRPLMKSEISRGEGKEGAQRIFLHLEPTQSLIETEVFQGLASFFELPNELVLKRRISHFTVFTLQNLLEVSGEVFFGKVLHSQISALHLTLRTWRLVMPSKEAVFVVEAGPIELKSAEESQGDQQHDFCLTLASFQALVGPSLKECENAIKGSGPSSLHICSHKGPSGLELSHHLGANLFFLGGTISDLLVQLSPENCRNLLPILESLQDNILFKKVSLPSLPTVPSSFWIVGGRWIAPSQAIKLSKTQGLMPAEGIQPFQLILPAFEKVVLNLREFELAIKFGEDCLLQTLIKDFQLDLLNQQTLFVVDGAVGALEILHSGPHGWGKSCLLRSVAEGGICFQFDERILLDSQSAMQSDGRRLLFYVNSMEVTLQDPFLQFFEQVYNQLSIRASDYKRFVAFGSWLFERFQRLGPIENPFEIKVAVENLVFKKPIQKFGQCLCINFQDFEFNSKEEPRHDGAPFPKNRFSIDVGGISLVAAPTKSSFEESDQVILLSPFKVAASGSIVELRENHFHADVLMAVTMIHTKLRADDLLLLDAASMDLLSDLVLGKLPSLFLETSPLLDEPEPLRLPIEKLPNFSFQVAMELEGFDAKIITFIGNYNHPLVNLHIGQFKISVDKKSPPAAEIKVGDLKLGVQIFNGKLLCWEPLVEPLTLAMLLNLSTTERSSLSIVAESGLYLNVSETMLEMLAIAFKQPLAIAERGAPEFISFKARNLTGCKIIIDGLYVTECTLESSAEATFSIRNSDWTDGALHPYERISLNVRLIHADRTFRMKEIPVDQEGEYLFGFPQFELETEPRVVCHTFWKDGIHFIDFHDGFAIQNCGQHNLEMKSLKSIGPVTLSTLGPNEEIPIPLLGRLHSTIQLRPSEDDQTQENPFDWCVEAIDLNQLPIGNSLVIACPQKNNDRVKSCFQVFLRRTVPTILNQEGRIDFSLASAPPPLPFYRSVMLLVTPTLYMQNLLPFDIIFTLTEVGSGSGFMRTIQTGQTIDLPQADIRKQLLLGVDIGDERVVKCHDSLIHDPFEEKKRHPFLRLETEDKQPLDLTLHYDPYYPDKDISTQIITLSAEYLIKNETSQKIFIKRHEAGHIFDDVVFEHILEPHDFEIPLKRYLLLSEKLIHDQFQFYIEGSNWTDRIDFRGLGTNTALKLTAGEDQHPFAQFGLHIEAGREGLDRSIVISIQPRYSLVNLSSFPIQVRECTLLGASVPAHLERRKSSIPRTSQGDFEERVVLSGEKLALHFQASDNCVRLQSVLRAQKEPAAEEQPAGITPIAGGASASEGTSAATEVDEPLRKRSSSTHIDPEVERKSGWSPPFSVVKEESLCLRLWNGDPRAKPRYVMATVTLEEATNEIVVTDCKKLPFMVENKLDEPVKFFQTPFGRKFVHSIMPKQDYPFGLDLPSHPDKTIEFEIRDSLIKVNPAEIGNEIATLPLPATIGDIEISTFLLDGIRIIRLCRQADEASLQPLGAERSKDTAVPSMASVPTLLKFTFNTPEIGISLIDDSPKELLFVSFQGIRAQFHLDNYDFHFSLQVIDHQVDYMQLGVSFPRLSFSRLNQVDHPFLQVAAKVSRVKDWDIENGLSFINVNHFSLNVQDLEVQIDEESLLQLLSLSDSITEVFERLSPTLQGLSLFKGPPSFDDYNFEHFYLSGIRAYITCKVHETFLERVGVVKRRPSVTSSLARGVRVLVLSSLRNLRRLPVGLSPIGFDQRRIPREVLISQLSRRYMKHAKSQLISIFSPLSRSDFFSDLPELPHHLPLSSEEREEVRSLHSQRAVGEEVGLFACSRRRWPRKLRKNGALTIYDPLEAFGNCVLVALKERYPRYSNDDYRYHFYLDAESDLYSEKISKICIITDLSILVIRVNSRLSTKKKPELKKELLELTFQLPLRDCLFVSEEASHVLVEYLPPSSAPLAPSPSAPPPSLRSSFSAPSPLQPAPPSHEIKWQHHFSCPDPFARFVAVKTIQELMEERNRLSLIPPF